VVEAVAEGAGLKADLRWRNDVLRGGRKLYGIVTALIGAITRVRYVVVGMGTNVNQPQFPPELTAIATLLRIESGRSLLRLELTATPLGELQLLPRRGSCDRGGQRR